MTTKFIYTKKDNFGTIHKRLSELTGIAISSKAHLKPEIIILEISDIVSKKIKSNLYWTFDATYICYGTLLGNHETFTFSIPQRSGLEEDMKTEIIYNNHPFIFYSNKNGQLY